MHRRLIALVTGAALAACSFSLPAPAAIAKGEPCVTRSGRPGADAGLAALGVVLVAVAAAGQGGEHYAGNDLPSDEAKLLVLGVPGVILLASGIAGAIHGHASIKACRAREPSVER